MQTTMMRTLKLAVATHLLLWGVCHGTPKGVSGERHYVRWAVGRGVGSEVAMGAGRRGEGG